MKKRHRFSCSENEGSAALARMSLGTEGQEGKVRAMGEFGDGDRHVEMLVDF